MCAMIVKRFEETYRALAEELKMEKLQLSRVHEQRVQSDLNEKKRVAMDNYMDALNDDASKVTFVTVFQPC